MHKKGSMTLYTWAAAVKHIVKCINRVDHQIFLLNMEPIASKND